MELCDVDFGAVVVVVGVVVVVVVGSVDVLVDPWDAEVEVPAWVVDVEVGVELEVEDEDLDDVAEAGDGCVVVRFVLSDDATVFAVAAGISRDTATPKRTEVPMAVVATRRPRRRERRRPV